MSDTTEEKKPAARRDTYNLSRLASDISSGVSRHEKMTADLLKLVSSRIANLEAMSKSLAALKARLASAGGVTEETAALLRKMGDDVAVNMRLSASMRVPLQRGPSLKNYKLMAGE